MVFATLLRRRRHPERCASELDRHEHDLAPAQGLAVGIGIGVVLWTAFLVWLLR
jgi:hypothetical protein